MENRSLQFTAFSSQLFRCYKNYKAKFLSHSCLLLCCLLFAFRLHSKE